MQRPAKSKRQPSAGKADAAPRPRKFIVPRAFARQTFALWAEGGPGRLLSKLADEAAGGDVRLKPDQLADLVELFNDEPLPASLRQAVTRHLRGKRVRRQGTPEKRTSVHEQIELIMLPGAYAEALKDAGVERERLRKLGQRKARYDDPNKLPAASSIACGLVKQWLPTLRDQSDRSLLNLISKVRKQLSDTDDGGLSPE